MLEWLVAGQLIFNNINSSKQRTLASNAVYKEIKELQDRVEKFCLIEECSHDRFYSKEEAECEEWFKKRVLRQSRFDVQLPLKESVATLGDSLEMATKRWFSLENMLAKNPTIRRQYEEIMSEYISLGHETKQVFITCRIRRNRDSGP